MENETMKSVTIKCPKHGEQTVFQPPYFTTTLMCPKCAEERIKREQEAERIEQEKERNRQRILAYQKSNVELEFWNKTLDDFKPQTPNQAKMLEATRTLIHNQRGKIILTGPNGVGKTMMGAMAVKALGGYIYSMYEISAMIRQSYSKFADRSELDIMNDLTLAPMLVIDEIGRTTGSKSEMNWLSYIVDKRHTRDFPMMILSNRHLQCNCPEGYCEECFESNFNDDIISRFYSGRIIQIEDDAPDWRIDHIN